MRKVWKWLGLLAIDILTSETVKAEIKKLWDKIDDFDYFWNEFVRLLKKI